MPNVSFLFCVGVIVLSGGILFRLDLHEDGAAAPERVHGLQADVEESAPVERIPPLCLSLVSFFCLFSQLCLEACHSNRGP